LWIEDLIRYARDADVLNLTDHISGIDVGTGPSCVYPLLSATIHKDWVFVATDVDESSCLVARENVETNGLVDRIAVIHNDDGSKIIMPAMTDPNSRFTFIMTNPPFYDGPTDLAECRQLKSNPSPDAPEYTDSEYFFPGGELAFIKIMIAESRILRDKCLWYTSVVAKKSNLKPIRAALREHEGIRTVCWTRWIQGTTSRWAVAWSYAKIPIHPADKLKKKSKMPKFGADFCKCIELTTCRADVLDALKTDFKDSYNIEVNHCAMVLLCTVKKNTWCRQSRRGHAPPDARFDFTVEINELKDSKRLVFKLPIKFSEQDTAFISLVSHLQRKFALGSK